jgi:predicted DNA binding CopG/RHH family protein
MKNNVRIYFRISSDFYEEIKKEAQNKGISVAQLCRQKLKTSDRMERMEFLLEKLSSSKK